MQKIPKIAFLVTLVLAAILAACASQPETVIPTPIEPTAAPENVDLENTSWKLVSFGQGDVETPVIEGSNLTLTFEPEGEMGGEGGCNSYGGSYQIEGQEITFEEIASTLRACAEDVLNQQEMDFLQALNQVDRFDLAGDNLTLFYGEQGVLNFTRAE